MEIALEKKDTEKGQKEKDLESGIEVGRREDVAFRKTRTHPLSV